MDMALLKKRVLPSEPRTGIITVSAPPLMQLSGGQIINYDNMHRTSAPVRAVVDFISLNLAQVGLAVFMRGPDDTRQRLGPKDPIVSLLRSPNSRTSGFEFRRDLWGDLLIAGNSYGIKVRDEGGNLAAVVRVRPSAVSIARDNDAQPTSYRVQFTGGSQTYPPEDVFHVRTYSEDGIVGTSPLESLRSVLAEDDAAVKNREGFWRNFARAAGWIMRPADAPPLTEDGWTRLRAAVTNVYTGEANAGKVGLLDEGMTFMDAAVSPKDAEFTEGRKFTLQIVCAVYGMPLQLMSGDNRNLDAAQRGLLTNSMAPWLSLLEEAITRDIVEDVHGDQAVFGRIFCEHVLEEKTRGSFAQQSEIFQRATGGAAWLTPNEIRAMLNRPPIPGGDVLLEPSNAIAAKSAELPELARGPHPIVTAEPVVIHPKVNINMPKRGRTLKRVIRSSDGKIAGIEETESPVEEAG
jgi:HK97 family phage portal protein